MALVTCGGCGLKFDRVAEEGEFIKGRWYHKGCAEIKRDKMSLDEYICKLFNLKTPGPMNNTLIKKYREQKGFNYKGMKNALQYFYEVKKHSTSKSEERVGIIPFIYVEAEEYFSNLEKRRSKNKATLEEEKVEIKINLKSAQQTEKTQDIDELNSLFEE